MIVVAVLLLCGLAGSVGAPPAVRRARRSSPVIAVLGLIGVSAQPGVSLHGYVPTVVGLLLGYLILSTLIDRLHRWRSRDGPRTPSTARRGFLGWTVVVGAAAAVAAVGGQLLASAAGAVRSARERLGTARRGRARRAAAGRSRPGHAAS